MLCPALRDQVMTTFPAGSRFQYKCPFRKAWVDVSIEEDNKLKDGYLKAQKGGPTEIAYIMNSVRFKTNFSSLCRINVASKRQMEVRLKGGDLPGKPPAGPTAPSPASLGKEDATPDESAVPEGVPLALKTPGPDGKQIGHDVRRAWGHTDPDIKGSMKFAFTMEYADKDYLGEMLAYHMKVADLAPEMFFKEVLSFTDKRGKTATNSKRDIQKMLSDSGSYPVHVSYDASKKYQAVPPERIPDIDTDRCFLRVIHEAANKVEWDIMKVKHKHQRRAFERFLLYMEEQRYQNEDDPKDAPDVMEYYQRYPWRYGMFNLIDKTGPNMGRILAGEADVLEFLFGA